MTRIYEAELNKEKLNKLPANASLDDKVNCYDDIVGYDELPDRAEFEYVERVGRTWSAVKVNNDYALLRNYYNRYIIAKRYGNCLSIGSGTIREYSTIEDAVRAINAGAYEED